MPWYPNGYVSGAKPTPERKREHERNATVGEFIAAAAKTREKKRTPNAKRSVQHFGTFRDGHNALRETSGRFAKETAPPHKRPRRIPWEKEGRNWKRRQKKGS